MSGEADLKLAEKFEKATVVLLDIAGTSSSICFVKDTLFPYVLNKAEPFLTKSWENAEVQEIVKTLRENDSDILKEGEKDSIIKSLINSVKTLTEKNSSLEAFKKFQGLLYKEGYDAGDIKGHVFPDVATQLPIWANGKRVCVYSTGSIESQKLLFTHSTEGNLSEHITEYFDMSVGVKTEAASYKTIAEKLHCKPADILYLTDSVAEAKAAGEVGISPILIFREGNEELSEDDKSQYPVINSFTELSSEASGKRKIIEEVEPEAPPAKVAKTEPETTEKVIEEKATSVNDVDEKMEVDSEVTAVKVDEPMEHKNNDTETVSSTSDPVEETKKSQVTVEPATESKDSEVKEEKPKGKENEKVVPSTNKKDEPKVEEKSENKTEEDKEASLNETKIEEDKKQTEKMDVSKETKETDKEIVEKTKETIKSKDNKVTVDSTENKETQDKKIDSSSEIKEGPKKVEKKESNVSEKKEESTVESSETHTETKEESTTLVETKTLNDKECEEKQETEETKENLKTESEVAKVDEKAVEKPEEKKEPKSKTNDSAQEIGKKTKETNEVDGVEDKHDKAEEVPAQENDEDKSKNTKENGESSSDKGKDKTEEKENQSELANGAHLENGDETKKLPEEEAEIKVKKIESENSETEQAAAVSVEVTA